MTDERPEAWEDQEERYPWEKSPEELAEEEALELLGEEFGLDPRTLEEMRAHGWNPMAPVNRGPDGEWVRKIRFPWGEWMWVRVESLEDRSGILLNDSTKDPALVVGIPLTFRLYAPGMYGGPAPDVEEEGGDLTKRFAAAVTWGPLL